MPEPQKPVSYAEAKPHFEHMLASGEFSGSDMYISVLQILFQSHRDQLHTDEKNPRLTEPELREKLGPQRNIKSLRSTIGKLRGKLREYNDKNKGVPIVFEIPKRRYWLDVSPRIPAGDSDRVQLLLRRNDPNDPFEELVCSPSEDILLISIAMAGVFDQFIQPWFRNNQIKAKHFRALTFRPRSPSVRGAFAAHLGQDESIHRKNIGDAWDKWKKLEKEQWTKAEKEGNHPTLEVYGYDLPPTAIGVCNYRSFKVELLPFNPIWRKENRRIAENRPALVINKADNSERYECFRGWFEDLWRDAKARTPEAYVHPGWRDSWKDLRGKILL